MAIVAACFHYIIIESFIGKMNMPSLLNNLYWIALYTKVLVFSMQAGTTTTSEAKRTANIVHKNINLITVKRDHPCLKKVYRLFIDL